MASEVASKLAHCDLRRPIAVLVIIVGAPLIIVFLVAILRTR